LVCALTCEIDWRLEGNAYRVYIFYAIDGGSSRFSCRWENTQSFDEMGTSVLGKKLLDILPGIVYLSYIMDGIADYLLF
jgi:hypothetical protein